MTSAFEGRSREELLALARTLNWWHSIDLGGFVTAGRVGRWPLIERAFDTVDFNGKKVLDVGCWDGLWSFEAEKRGAAEVYSVDYVSLRSWSEQSTYQLAHMLLGSRARYFPNLSVYDIDRVGVSDFDVVVFCGLYYHLTDPLRALTAVRSVMKEGALLIVEGPVLDGSIRAYADFHARTWYEEDPTNWWVPTMTCLREWLDCTFFDVTAEFSLRAGLGSPAPPPPSAAPVPGTLVQRLRRGIGEAFRGAEAAPVPAREESRDRVSLVARATSVAERLAARVHALGLPALVPGEAVSAECARSFCDAAAVFERAAPWNRVRHDRAIKLECPELRAEPVFLMVLGRGAADRGLVVHFQRPGFVMAVQGLLLGEQITWPPFLALFFSDAARLPAGEAQALDGLGCAAAAGAYPLAIFNDGHGGTTRPPGSTLRRPRAGELQLLEACLRAVPEFLERNAAGSAPEQITVAAAGTDVRTRVAWVIEGEREL